MRLMKCMNIVFGLGMLCASFCAFSDPAPLPSQQLTPTIDQIQNAGVATGLFTTPPSTTTTTMNSMGVPTETSTISSGIDNSAKTVTDTHFNTYQNTTDPSVQYGDLKISTMLGPDSYTSAQQAAVRQFMNNLIDSTPDTTTQLPNASVNTSDAATQGTFAKGAATQALMSVARQAFAEIYARRLAPSSLTPPQGGSITIPGTIMQMVSSDPTSHYYNQQWQQTNQTNLNKALCLQQQKNIFGQLAFDSSGNPVMGAIPGCQPDNNLYTLVQIAQMLAWQNAVMAENFRQEELRNAIAAVKVVQDAQLIVKLNSVMALGSSTGGPSGSGSTPIPSSGGSGGTGTGSNTFNIPPAGGNTGTGGSTGP